MSLPIHFFSAQLWKLSKNGRLKNKYGQYGYDGEWSHAKKTWNIPKEKEWGFIEHQESGMVLGSATNNGEINLEEKLDPDDEKQLWYRTRGDTAGWFELKKKNTRKVLSAQRSRVILDGRYHTCLWHYFCKIIWVANNFPYFLQYIRNHSNIIIR